MSKLNQSPIRILTGKVVATALPELIIKELVLEPETFEDLPEHLYLETPNLAQTLHAPVIGRVHLQGDSGGESFIMEQLHFHVPAEHLVDETEYPAEIHLRLENGSSDRLSVLAIFVKVGEANAAISAILRAREEEVLSEVDLRALAPALTSYYSYVGSTTTAPLVDDVTWFILREPIEVSEQQLEQLRELHRVGNRELQELGERQVSTNLT